MDPAARRRRRRWRSTRRLATLLLVCGAGWGCFAAQSFAQTAPAAAPLTGSISGTVVDPDGALVPDAHVLLTAGDSATTHEALADDAGGFRFDGVAPGPYKLAVTANGMAAGTATGVLRSGEAADIAAVVLRVAVATTDIEVTKTREEIAEIEIQHQEQQRLFGFAPNFFVSYTWDAQPLTVRQKYQLAWKSFLDPVNFLIVGGNAGVQQATNEFPGYGQGAQGYAKRYGASYADLTIGITLGGAILPSLFHQDPRYFYKGTGSKTSRALYALSTAFRQRGDNGKWQVGYSSILGDMATGAISNIYYPASDRNGAQLTLENGLLSIGLDGVTNLVQEFIFRRVSTGVKRSAGDPMVGDPMH